MTGSDRKVGRENLRNRVALLVLGAGAAWQRGSEAARWQAAGGGQLGRAGQAPTHFHFRHVVAWE